MREGGGGTLYDYLGIRMIKKKKKKIKTHVGKI